MNIKILLNNDSKDIIGEFKARKNATHKTIIENVKKYISKEYNCNVTRLLITGSINYLTGVQDFSYILFGENLPFRNIKIIETEV